MLPPTIHPAISRATLLWKQVEWQVRTRDAKGKYTDEIQGGDVCEFVLDAALFSTEVHGVAAGHPWLSSVSHTHRSHAQVRNTLWERMQVAQEELATLRGDDDEEDEVDGAEIVPGLEDSDEDGDEDGDNSGDDDGDASGGDEDTTKDDAGGAGEEKDGEEEEKEELTVEEELERQNRISELEKEVKSVQELLNVRFTAASRPHSFLADRAPIYRRKPSSQCTLRASLVPRSPCSSPSCWETLCATLLALARAARRR